jgi:hypothetical protein
MVINSKGVWFIPLESMEGLLFRLIKVFHCKPYLGLDEPITDITKVQLRLIRHKIFFKSLTLLQEGHLSIINNSAITFNILCLLLHGL